MDSWPIVQAKSKVTKRLDRQNLIMRKRPDFQASANKYHHHPTLTRQPRSVSEAYQVKDPVEDAPKHARERRLVRASPAERLTFDAGTGGE